MNTTTTSTDRGTWRQLFEKLTGARTQQPVTIDILNEEIGDQTETHRMPLQSLDYDDRNNVIVITVGSRRGRGFLRHLIHDPIEVDLVDRPDHSLAMRIVDEGGTETLVTFDPRLDGSSD